MTELLSDFAARPDVFIQSALFYVFATVLLFSAVMVVSAGNRAVHAVLFLILAFFNAAGLFLLLGAEFLAMILLVVYVGAVAVFFLFVVMMLDLDFHSLKRKAGTSLPIGLVIGAILASELAMLGMGWSVYPDVEQMETGRDSLAFAASNTEALGRVLYTDYLIPFQLSGLVLLVAMIGAIVLTLKSRGEREGLRRQEPPKQMARDAKDVISVVKVETGKGVSL